MYVTLSVLSVVMSFSSSVFGSLVSVPVQDGPGDFFPSLTNLISIFSMLGKTLGIFVVSIMILDLFFNSDFQDAPVARVMVRVNPVRPIDDFQDLPPEAVAKISHIRVLLGEIRASCLPGEATEDAHVIKEMDVTYLPSTVAAYEAIPKSHRGNYDSRLLEQLSILERRTQDVLERTVEDRVRDLSANGRFLKESFANPSSALGALIGG